MTPETWASAPSPAVLLLLALGLEAVLHGPGRRGPPAFGPMAPVRALAAGLDRRLNREKRSAATRRARGALVAALIVALAAAAGWALERLARGVPYGWLAEIVVLVALVDPGSLWRQGRAAARASGGADGGGAARAANRRGDGQPLDRHGVARGAVEACAGGFAARVVSPVFWFAVIGLPGLVICRAVDAADDVLGHRTPRHAAFGMAVAGLDDALQFIPARLAAVLIAAGAAFAPGAAPLAAARAMWRDAGRHPSLNRGWPLAAMAGALGLALAGPRRGGGAAAPWIGEGRARAEAADIGRALYVLAAAGLIGAALIALAGTTGYAP